MTIWTVELLHQTRASLSRLIRALDVDLPKQRPGESAKSTLQNLKTSAALGMQEVIIISENGDAVAIASVRCDTKAKTGYARLLYVVPGVESAVADMIVQEVFERVWRDEAMVYFDGQTFVDQPDIRASFALHGVTPVARQDMEISDLSLFSSTPAPTLSDGFYMAPWWPNPGISLADSHLDAVAELIIDAYRGTIDENLFPGLNTHTGLRQFFDEILYDNHSAFDHDASRIIYDGSGKNQMAGQIFCSRTRDKMTYVLELTVHPTYRRRGLGRALMGNMLQSIIDRALVGAQLTVTVENPARRLYETLGFKMTVPKWVYIAIRPEPSNESSD